MSKHPHLFSGLKVGSIATANRIFMAPLTRCRAIGDHVPSPLIAEYYSQRATAGLIITEATFVNKNGSAFMNEPGLHSEEQVAGWKNVTAAVHAKGGKVVFQIYHGGRTNHPINNNGVTPIAPSAIRVEKHKIAASFSPSGEALDYVLPKEMTTADIQTVIAEFAHAAKNSIAAGADGVEIHGANGYLLDQFLRSGSNTRTDRYGGSIENRARLLLEVVDAVGAAIGVDKVGVRLSPLNSYQEMVDSDPVALATYVAKQLNERKIAYIHLMRADFFQAQKGDVVTPVREAFRGTLILNMGYTADEAEATIASGAADAVAFGVPILANPDFVERVRVGAELNAPNPATFYGRGAEGYTDYPLLKA